MAAIGLGSKWAAPAMAQTVALGADSGDVLRAISPAFALSNQMLGGAQALDGLLAAHPGSSHEGRNRGFIPAHGRAAVIAKTMLSVEGGITMANNILPAHLGDS